MSVVAVALLAAGTRGWVLYTPQARYTSQANPGYLDATYTPQGVPTTISTTKWLDPSTFNLNLVPARWSMPPPETTTCGGSEPGNYTPATTGLAGGITFALHKDFCTKLLPLFPEENPSGAAQETTFLTCENLRDVVKRSLDTWAINHRSIYFTDVTELCKEETSFSSCPHAEIFIVSNDLPPSSGGDRAAVAQPTFTSGRVYTTAGQRIDNGYEINSAVITVRTPADKDELCWYLDSTFCFQFHRWQDAEVDVVSIARLVCSVMFIIAFFICVWILGSTCSAFCGNPDAGEYDDEYEEEGEPGQSPPPSPPEVDKPELDKSRFTSMHHMHGGAGSFHDILRKAGAAGIGEHGDEEHLTCGSQRCTNMMEYISVMPTIPLLASIFWMCFAPVFYYRVFQPCWECHGFEASLTHEIGHVLGFHHPDVECVPRRPLAISTTASQTRPPHFPVQPLAAALCMSRSTARFH